MTWQRAINSEIPQVAPQIDLFYVLPNFSRKVTADMMGITSAEKSKVLSHIQYITYSGGIQKHEEGNLIKYTNLCGRIPKG